MYNFYDDNSESKSPKVSSVKLLLRFVPYLKPHRKSFAIAVFLLLYDHKDYHTCND